MAEQPLTDTQLKTYQSDGYLVVRRLFDAEEIDLLRWAAKEDRVLEQKAFGRDDGEGGNVRLSLWSRPGDDIYGTFARCRRIGLSVQQILGGQIGHYHTKIIMKDAKVGGAWAWHQDYGYWYDVGYLYPQLCSVMIAIDEATRVNGCLQVIRKSHLLGRINHSQTGDQAGADPERVREVLEQLELTYCEMQPGDAVFFHCNTLHRSDQNRSDVPRWALICCYTRLDNQSKRDPLHPDPYPELAIVPDEAIKRVGVARIQSSSKANFLEPHLHFGQKTASTG